MKPFCAALAIALSFPLAAQAVQIPIRSDSYIDSANPTTNYGSAAVLPANGTGKTVLLKFKAMSAFLPAGTTSSGIARAMLNVWIGGSTNNSAHFIVKKANADWTEGTLTVGNAPTTAALPAPFTDPTALSNMPQWVNVDITDLVKYWVDNPGDAGRSVVLSTTAGEVSIDSKENTNTSHAAFIDVTLVGPTGATGAIGPTGATGPTGPAGPGVPVGGNTGQVLSKIDGTDYNTQWVTPSSGGSDATSIQSVAVSSTTPTSGQVLAYDGTNWVPTTPSGGGTTLPSQTSNGGKFLKTDGTNLFWSSVTYSITLTNIRTTTGVTSYTVPASALGGYVFFNLQNAADTTANIEVDATLPGPTLGGRVKFSYTNYGSGGTGPNYAMKVQTPSGTLHARTATVSASTLTDAGFTSEFISDGTDWYEVPGT